MSSLYNAEMREAAQALLNLDFDSIGFEYNWKGILEAMREIENERLYATDEKED